MDEQKELIKKIFDFMVASLEIAELRQKKELLIREQKYPEADECWKKEKEVRQSMPFLEDLKTLREKI